MKYVVANDDDGNYLLLEPPLDDEGPDPVMNFIFDQAGEEDRFYLPIRASQFYTFVDCVRRWLADPREEVAE